MANYRSSQKYWVFSSLRNGAVLAIPVNLPVVLNYGHPNQKCLLTSHVEKYIGYTQHHMYHKIPADSNARQYL